VNVRVGTASLFPVEVQQSPREAPQQRHCHCGGPMKRPILRFKDRDLHVDALSGTGTVI
jgi:hypothetical protein